MSANPCISQRVARGKRCVSRKPVCSEPLVVKHAASPSSPEDTGSHQHRSPMEKDSFVIRKKFVVVTKCNLALIFWRIWYVPLCHSRLLLEQLNFVIHWKADEILKSVQSITRLLHINSTFIAGSLCLLFIYKILRPFHACHLGLGENWCYQIGTDCYIYAQMLPISWFIHHRLFLPLTYILFI